MQYRELIERRRSIRSFKKTPVEPEKLEAILKAVRTCPTAGNLQAYRVVVVTSPETKKKLAEAALGQHFIEGAPVVLVFLADPERSGRRYGNRGKELYSVQDATIATTFAMLAAADEGLGSVWVGAFIDDMVWKAVGSPPGLRPVAVLPIGHPAEEPSKTSRRPPEELFYRIE